MTPDPEDRPWQQPREPRGPRDPQPTRVPFSRPPAAPRSWWGTMPGQLALVAIFVGAIVILLGALGIIGPLAD